VYEGVRATVEAETAFPEHQAYWLITISAGEHSARAAIDWAEETLASLDGQRERYVR
jgi:hypothetical protein